MSINKKNERSAKVNILNICTIRQSTSVDKIFER